MIPLVDNGCGARWVLVERLELVPPATDGAPLVIGATLEMMESRCAGRQEAVSDWTECHGLSLEA